MEIKTDIKIEPDNEMKPESERKRKCSLPNCSYEGNQGFFKFPKDEKMRFEWVKNCGGFDAGISGTICHNHFASTCFKPKMSWQKNDHMRIWPNAIPTRNLPTEEDFQSDKIDHNYSIDAKSIIEKLTKENKDLKNQVIALKRCNKKKITVDKPLSRSKKEDIVREILQGQLTKAQIEILMSKSVSLLLF